MTHFVLYARRRRVTADELEKISEAVGVTVLDGGLGGALLVDASADSADKLRKMLPGWIVAEEIEFPPPGLLPYEIKGDDD